MHPAAIAGIAAGGAGGLMSGISSMFGGGGGGDMSEAKTGSGWAYRLLEKSPWGSVPWKAGRALDEAWRYGQLPLPLQRAMQAIQPMTQMLYSGATDELARGSTAAREDVARRMAEMGVTGPQMTKYMSDIDFGMRMGDLAATREGQSMYANALANAWQTIYGQGFSEPARLMSIAAGIPSEGSNLPNILAGAGNIGSSIGEALVNSFGWGSSVPNYAAAIGREFGGGPSWSLPSTSIGTIGGTGSISKASLPSIGSSFKDAQGNYIIPGINMP